MNAALSVVQQPQPMPLAIAAPLRFSSEQRTLILQTCCGGASEQEAGALLAIAEARGLNPLLQECYFVKRWDNDKRREAWAVQAAIESFRIKAEETGDYAGQDEPEYEYDNDGNVRLARVRVYRKSVPGRAFAVGVAYWSEYAQTKRDGSLTKFWAKMPHNQLAKCAEALGLRKAFPKVLSKVYVPEEMAQADSGVESDDRAPSTSAHDPQTGELPHEPGGNAERSADELRALADMKAAIAATASKADEQRIITQILRNPFSDESRAELKKAIEARRRKLAAEARKARSNGAANGSADAPAAQEGPVS